MHSIVYLDPFTTSLNCVPRHLVHLVHHLSTMATNANKIKEWTRRDPILSKVYYHISSDVINNVDESLHPYRTRKDELSVSNGFEVLVLLYPPPGDSMY